MPIGVGFLPACLLILLTAGAAWAQTLAPSGSNRPEIVDHHLTVVLTPHAHQLAARDETTVSVPAGTTNLSFMLASSLHVESVGLQAEAGGSEHAEGKLLFTSVRLSEPSSQRIEVTLPSPHAGRVTLVWTYRGLLNDPPKEPRHLRFVTPSETAGHIGPEGVYLSSESQWYPDIEGSLSRFEVTAETPSGWIVVTQGTKLRETQRERSTTSTWSVTDRSEALTLVANTFVTATRRWTGPNGQQVELATYFSPDNAGLADEYLEATARYLDAYVPLLGDYPFTKFAVVENFFASGLGMPSFTLLGSGSIKRHYVQPYALGHEIVHSWIGNSVFNRTDQGNWVEGLTTYLANYYWYELTDEPSQAREQRRLMIHSYSLHVSPADEYPVAAFTRKHDERDNAIGYQKAAFVFHLLRREIGDEPFWRGLKTFVSRYRNAAADWGSLERSFSEVSGRDLRWFFTQWIEQPGAPVLSLGEVTASRPADAGPKAPWRLNVTMRQTGGTFRMAVPLRVFMKDRAETRWVTTGQAEDQVEFVVPDRPLQVRLDPDMMAFRRLSRQQLAPVLNMYVTDVRRTLVEAYADPASPLRQISARIAGQETPLPPEQKTRRIFGDLTTIHPEGSVLVLAGPDQQAMVSAMVKDSCGDRVMLNDAGFQLDGRTYEGPTMAVLFSCHRAQAPGSVITVLYGMSSQAVTTVSRLLFYYGWHSAVVFHEGSVVRRDLWEPVSDLKEVHLNAYE